jgi:hypothetical protein
MVENTGKLNIPMKFIVEDLSTGKLKVSDTRNFHAYCDIYGNPLPKFKKDISGCISRSVDKTFLDTKLKRASESDYLPTITRFEGYFAFPSPLSSPFGNRQNNLKFNSDLKDKAQSIYSKVEKNSSMFKIPKNENKGVSYLTNSFNLNDLSLRDKNDMKKLIENYFQERKEENKYKLNVLDNDSKMKALKKFKKWMMDNHGDKKINGRYLNSPSKLMKMEYSAVKKCVLKKSGESLPKKKIENLSTHESSYKHADYSFLSDVSEQELRFSHVRSRDYFDRKYQNEKKYIGGFVEEPEREPPIVRKHVKNTLKTNGELWDSDMALLRKSNLKYIYLKFYLVNPIIFEKRKKQEEYDFIQLAKKKKSNELKEQIRIQSKN